MLSPLSCSIYWVFWLEIQWGATRDQGWKMKNEATVNDLSKSNTDWAGGMGLVSQGRFEARPFPHQAQWGEHNKRCMNNYTGAPATDM